jgi:hypothetical protein
MTEPKYPWFAWLILAGAVGVTIAAWVYVFVSWK